jgi:methionyl-tRNA synthetase
MSKSKGNIIDPVELIEKYGVDALKYFLLREYSFGSDGKYSTEALIKRVNGDLANDLGNLLSRTCGMAEKYFDGAVKAYDTKALSPTGGKELRGLAISTPELVESCMDEFDFSHALEHIWHLIGEANKYIDLNEPWVLATEAAKQPLLEAVLYDLLEVLRIVSVLLTPYMHHSATEIRAQLGITQEITWTDAGVFGQIATYQVSKGEALFPRIEIDKTV